MLAFWRERDVFHRSLEQRAGAPPFVPGMTLDLIARHRLNAGQRADYDSARRFLAQAEGAVKENNLLLAESSGEKAETLADGLK